MTSFGILYVILCTPQASSLDSFIDLHNCWLVPKFLWRVASCYRVSIILALFQLWPIFFFEPFSFYTLQFYIIFFLKQIECFLFLSHRFIEIRWFFAGYMLILFAKYWFLRFLSCIKAPALFSLKHFFFELFFVPLAACRFENHQPIFSRIQSSSIFFRWTLEHAVSNAFFYFSEIRVPFNLFFLDCICCIVAPIWIKP